MTTHQIMARTSVPAYTTDVHRRIVEVNRSAERILGFKSSEVCGKPCYQVFAGKDLYGNIFCHQRCAVMSMVERGEPVSPFELQVSKASGEKLGVCVNVVVFPDRSGPFTAAHLLHPILGHGARQARSSMQDPGNGAHPTGSAMTSSHWIGAKAFGLTDREIEVLRLLMRGTSCRDISSTLSISIATTRNHIRHILKKLDVHSQAEAIAFSSRNRLL